MVWCMVWHTATHSTLHTATHSTLLRTPHCYALHTATHSTLYLLLRPLKHGLHLSDLPTHTSGLRPSKSYILDGG
jgi:hypothetical protein